jgi:hypothetical protein
MRPILRYKLRTAFDAVTLVAIVLAVHMKSIETHRREARVIASIHGIPPEINLLPRNRIGSLPNGLNGGRAYFEFRGPHILRRLAMLADARYSCRVTKIVLCGPSYTDMSLERLGELPFLRELTLVNTRVTDAAIARLKRRIPLLRVNPPRRVRIIRFGFRPRVIRSRPSRNRFKRMVPSPEVTEL